MTLILTGGTPISLIEKVNESINDHKIDVGVYETVGINFTDGIQSLCIENIEKVLEDQIFNLKEQVFLDSNERTWRSLFWDSTIMKLFRSETGLPEPAHYYLSSDWKRTTLFPDQEMKRIDQVCQFKLNDLTIPILIVEYGSRNDEMKLSSTLILLCSRMVRKLEQCGKKAELARVYGLRICGSHIQMIVAHPIIKKIEGSHSKYDVDIILTTRDHWHLDILNTESNSECMDVCCTHSDLIELVIEPESQITDTPSTKPILCNSKIALDKLKREAKTSMESDHVKAYNGTINLTALNKLKLFIILVKRRIALLTSESSRKLDLNSKRKFKDRLRLTMPSSTRSSDANKSLYLKRKSNKSKSKKKSRKSFTIKKVCKCAGDIDILLKIR